MAFKKTFVLSDESINTYGFWVLLSGMDLSGVQKNCPLYYEHRTWEIPLGHVENIRMGKDQVLGDVVIDGGNDEEREYIRKIENGDIKGCSFGFDPTEWSEEPTLLKQGQTRATLSKCIPFELSLAPLPGNKNALALRNVNDMITLSADKHYDFIPDLKTQINMKKITVLLGMNEAATEDQICEMVKAIQAKAGTVEQLSKTIEETAVVGLNEQQKAFFISLSKTNMVAALEFVTLAKTEAVAKAEAGATDATPAGGVQLKAVKISELIKPGAATVDLAKDGKDCYDYLQRHNTLELARIKSAEPEKFAELQKGYKDGVRFKA